MPRTWSTRLIHSQVTALKVSSCSRNSPFVDLVISPSPSDLLHFSSSDSDGSLLSVDPLTGQLAAAPHVTAMYMYIYLLEVTKQQMCMKYCSSVLHYQLQGSY